MKAQVCTEIWMEQNRSNTSRSNTALSHSLSEAINAAMTSLSHDFRQFWGLTKYMTESGYGSGRGEGEISQILDILHPFSTTVINKRLLEPEKDM